MRWGEVARTEARNPYADVQVELTAMVFNRLMPTVMMGGLVMVVATAAIAHLYHDPWLWWLTAAMAVLSVGRVGFVLRFPSNPIDTLTAKTAERWELLYGYYTAALMCTMSLSTLRSIHSPDSVHFLYCVFGTFALCNAISARLGLRPRLVLLQGSVMIAALVVAVLQQKHPVARWSVTLLLGYGYTFWEAVSVKYDITVEQLRSRRKQRHLAEHDALTGLANRRHFEARLSALCEGTQPFAVFFLDLDGFKKVNDGYGHATGDTLLQHVARRLEASVRRSDLTARLGGDEFAVLHAPDATRDTASALAERLIAHISDPYRVEDVELRIGVSIGIQLSNADQSDPDRLLSQADLALYAVKQTGKGRFYFATEDRSPPRDANGSAHAAPASRLLTAP